MRNMSYSNDYHINKISIDLDKMLNKIYYKFINSIPMERSLLAYNTLRE